MSEKNLIRVRNSCWDRKEVVLKLIEDFRNLCKLRSMFNCSALEHLYNFVADAFPIGAPAKEDSPLDAFFFEMEDNIEKYTLEELYDRFMFPEKYVKTEEEE